MNIPLNINLQQILLHLFNFAILGGGLYILLYKPVKDFMAKRTAYYQELDERTNQALKEAETYKAEVAAEREQLDQTLREEAAQRQQELQTTITARLTESRAQAEQIVTDAKKKAEEIQEKTLSDAQSQIKQLVISATEKAVLRPGEDPFDHFLRLAEEETA